MNISDKDFFDLVCYFLDEVTPERGRWSSPPYPGIDRLFPCHFRELLLIWYQQGGLQVFGWDSSEVEKKASDLERFARFLERAFNARDIRWKHKESRTSFNRSIGSYKYIFPSFRFTAVGLLAYAQLERQKARPASAK